MYGYYMGETDDLHIFCNDNDLYVPYSRLEQCASFPLSTLPTLWNFTAKKLHSTATYNIFLCELMSSLLDLSDIPDCNCGCGVAQWLACQTVDVQSRVWFSPGDCWFPVLGSILTKSPPSPCSPGAEVTNQRGRARPGWQPGWILY
jgi:hypothetical protein